MSDAQTAGQRAAPGRNMRHPVVQVVPLAIIALDRNVWPRFEAYEERIALFIELLRDARESAGYGQGWTDPLPPLVVVADTRIPGQPIRYLLADGWHRCEARRRLGAGFEHVQVQVYSPDGQAPEAIAYQLAVRHAIGPTPLTIRQRAPQLIG